MERLTRQRSAIVTVIEAAGRPLSPQEICAAAQVDVPGLGIATVYRTLSALLEAQEIRSIDLPGEPPRYERAGLAHHHHFRCESCNRVFDVEGCPGNLEALAPAGFRATRHELILYGRCIDCEVRPGPSRRPAASARLRRR